MKRIFLLLLMVVVSCQAFNRDLDEDWSRFKETYNKQYHRREEHRRRAAFESNVEKIAKYNREYDLGLHSHRLGLNQYADLTNKEFNRQMNGHLKKSHQSEHFFKPTMKDLPDTVDWRTKNVVTRVKNQGSCTVWAFALTGVLESQHAIITGKLVELSEQNLADCVGSGGCGGGSIIEGYEYIIKNGGIDTEDSYPGPGQNGTCRFNPDGIGATMRDYKVLPAGDEAALKEAVATIGPIAVAIDASAFDFQLYISGVYDNPECSSTLLDHTVLVVGYGTEDGKDYWLCKNSWGTNWGEEGYIKMSRNKNNQCGIATSSSYPIV